MWRSLYVNPLWRIMHPLAGMDAGVTLREYYAHAGAARYTSVLVEDAGSRLLVTPEDVLRYLYENRMLDGVDPAAVASRLVAASPGTRVIDVIELMLGRWIRRLPMGGRILTDRLLADCYLFHARSLQILSRDPDSLLEAPVDSLQGCLVDPPRFSEGEDVYSVAEKVLGSNARAAVTADLSRIVTPFDLAVRPFVPRDP
ncbi:hypothetical protein [Conexivisphaera calida]|uniref:Uncharacterized protein n=1 Tax=Conexivisphaera calida TaxID=1874277 RepID=A0A4P2VEJ1_9ARCH|nr:hypothetical protein [Conexivisphaera calida]BBE42407.1 hypothetical protein NAS2_1018 [Conexivisphaera calida]